MWWTTFTKEEGTYRNCGDIKCFITEDRKYRNHPKTKVFLFYGTDLSERDLPLPRLPHHEWGLLHEESPHNIYMLSHPQAISLFNHTSTFRRQSHYPITTQYLTSIHDLQSKKYMKSVKEKNEARLKDKLALVNFVQSDCGSTSDRDHWVEMLQRHIQVDSYGKCLHNRDLPEHLQDPLQGMDHEDFYKHLAQYKFTIAFENAVCDDYITEKFWRPFIVGSVPIIFGSPKAKDFLPSNKSAILVNDFNNIDEIVELITYLDKNDDEYNKYLEFKHSGVTNEMLLETMSARDWGIDGQWDQPHYVQGFECFICRRLHDNIQKNKAGQSINTHTATMDHYGCPEPTKFSDDPAGNLTRVRDEPWSSAWLTGRYIAMATREAVDNGVLPQSNKVFMDRVLDLYKRYEIKDEL